MTNFENLTDGYDITYSGVHDSQNKRLNQFSQRERLNGIETLEVEGLDDWAAAGLLTLH